MIYLLKWFFLGIFFCLITLLYSCSVIEPPTTSSPLILSLEDISCTDVWLRIKAEYFLFDSIALMNNNQIIKTYKLFNNDTVVNIHSPSINKNYSFKLSGKSTTDNIYSNTLSVQALDTTSSNFNWQSFTFGSYGSALYDAVIIDENDIWVVGEIHFGDTIYNAVHWDGYAWKYFQFQFYSFCGNPSTYSYPANSILAINKNDIWVGAFAQVAHFKGDKQVSIECLPISIKKMWGTDSANIYAVGYEGKIAHYDGTKWQVIESGTDVKLLDIWGDPNGKNIWICGWQDFKPTVLLKYSNNKIEKVIEDDQHLSLRNDTMISGIITSIWTNDDKKLFVLTTQSIFRNSISFYSKPNAFWKYHPSFWGSRRLRGNFSNDLFTSGDFSRIWHYNGDRWKTFDNMFDLRDKLYGMDVKKDIVVAVGERSTNGVQNYGLIHIGRR